MDKKLRTPIAATMHLILSLLPLFELTEICMQLFHYQNFFHISIIPGIVINLFLSIMLFTKKRDNLFVIAVGCPVLLTLYYIILNLCFGYFSFGNLLSLVADVLMLVFALAFCEQSFVKADFSKVKELAGKVFYLPAVITLALNVFNWVNSLNTASFIPFLSYASALLNFIALLSLAMWLKDPYTKLIPTHEVSNEVAHVEEEYGEAYCSLGKHIVLCLFTFGIWYLIWTYRTTKYLNKAPNAIPYSPAKKLLLCMFVPFYQIYWFYKHGQRIDGLSRQKKLNNSDMSTLCLILGIFIPIVACIIMQDRINTICTAKAVIEDPATGDPATEQLKKYKELFDGGVISQEEFDAKKKQLLGL